VDSGGLLQEFARLFNEKQFFEAHEVLEDLWKVTPGSLRKVYQGMIQIAAAMVHVQKGTPEGARQLLKKETVQALEFLETECRIDTVSLLKETRACIFQSGDWPKIKFR